MRSNLVVTLIGDDRPGLVEAIAETVAAHGGNWEESRMAHLAGKFAGLLRVSVPTDAVEALESALGELGRSGLRIVAESSERVSPGGPRRLRLELVGNDREGIVRDLSHALATREVNVEELHTSCQDAPMGGGQLFHATAVLGLPAAMTPEELREALEDMADDLMVDLSVASFDDESSTDE
ncbi:MAG: ACT domain-containing protein [Myxococcales bacterium]|jgi:glycine cleavage system regulatory protein